jgi:hypothetical protein
MKIYLAGKISKNDWRNEIINTRGIEHADGSVTIQGDIYTGPYFVSCDHGCYHGDSTHGVIDSGCGSGDRRTIEDQMCYEFGVCDADGGHGCVNENDIKDTIPKLCLSWIDECDVVFAWIDSNDCFGTIAEIGYAYGKEKEIWIGYSNKLVMGYADRPTEFINGCTGECVGMPIHDMWFIDRVASKVAVSPCAEMLYSRWSTQRAHESL